MYSTSAALASATNLDRHRQHARNDTTLDRNTRVGPGRPHFGQNPFGKHYRIDNERLPYANVVIYGCCAWYMAWCGHLPGRWAAR